MYFSMDARFVSIPVWEYASMPVWEYGVELFWTQLSGLEGLVSDPIWFKYICPHPSPRDPHASIGTPQLSRGLG